jgi:hypothetical protein
MTLSTDLVRNTSRGLHMRGQRETEYNQRLFLDAYSKSGTIETSARAAGISRECVRRWDNENVFGFRDQFQAAKDQFKEAIEDILFDRLRDPKCPPLLLIFALNAHDPAKYKATTLPDTESHDMLVELRSWAQRDARRQQQHKKSSVKPDPDPTESMPEGIDVPDSLRDLLSQR